ncbi:MAG: hypothetical protein ABFC77_08770 [Thermoguttaceae bacterium]
MLCWLFCTIGKVERSISDSHDSISIEGANISMTRSKTRRTKKKIVMKTIGETRWKRNWKTFLLGSVVVLGGLIAFLANLSTITDFFEPEIVWMPDNRSELNGQLRTEPNGGVTVRLYGKMAFENISWRRGGHVDRIKVTPCSLLESLGWFPGKNADINSAPFEPREKKLIPFDVVFEIRGPPKGNNYDRFSVELQFLDHNGAVIRSGKSGKPYSFSTTIAPSVMDVLKAKVKPGDYDILLTQANGDGTSGTASVRMSVKK